MADPFALDLQAASFRGVPFHVDGSSFEAGRRVQVHEYPQRDKPWAEDLGRATRTVSVDAFLIGADYIDQANALIAAAEEEGAGTLVHPWLGSMQVSLKDPCRVRFDSALGRAVVYLSFVESGELEFPAASDSTQSLSQLGADSLCAAQSKTSRPPSALPTSRRLSATWPASTCRARSTTPPRWAAASAPCRAGPGSLQALASGGISTLLGGTLTSLLGTPLALAQGLMDMFDLSGIVAALSLGDAVQGPTYATAAGNGTVTDPLAAIALGIVGLAGNGGAGGVLNAPVPVASATLARQQRVENTAAINALVRRALLAQAVGISSAIDTTVQADARAVRDALCKALDVESLVADDVSYAALQAARQAVWTDLTTRSSEGARLITITPTDLLPALVTAYDQYEDAGRGDELVARNHIVHPGFVPLRALQVLSR